MKTLRLIEEIRNELGARSGLIGLVPTMGALHAGHEALIGAARAENDVVVVSLFVNPAQFDEGGDLAAYPQDEEQDAAPRAAAGADLLAPYPDEIYPPGYPDLGRRRGALARARGRSPTRPLPRRRNRVPEALQHRPPRPAYSARRMPSRWP